MTNKLVLASNNQGKIKELQQMLAGQGVEVLAQSAFAIADIEETGLTFVENALIKARHASSLSGLPAVADDSGLEVDALNGAPGIYSARFSGPGANDASNNRKLLELLQDVPEEKRTARFQCLLVYLRHAEDPTPLICQGTWEGRILFEPQGDNGFGYDPLFWVEDRQCSSAELPREIKNQLSHRAKATRQLQQLLGA